MADEQKPKARKKSGEPKAEGGAEPAPATTAGAPKGKKAPAAAPVVEAAPAHPQTKSLKVPKLQKKNKSRLPRRQKKALQKAAATQPKV
jgi:hypothetical protein